jgi:hypothetical protein
MVLTHKKNGHKIYIHPRELIYFDQDKFFISDEYHKLNENLFISDQENLKHLKSI